MTKAEPIADDHDPMTCRECRERVTRKIAEMVSRELRDAAPGELRTLVAPLVEGWLRHVAAELPLYEPYLTPKLAAAVFAQREEQLPEQLTKGIRDGLARFRAGAAVH
jgi:hypothetical protein